MVNQLIQNITESFLSVDRHYIIGTFVNECAGQHSTTFVKRFRRVWFDCPLILKSVSMYFHVM